MPDFIAAAAMRVEQLTVTEASSARSAEFASHKRRIWPDDPHYVCAEIGKAISADDVVMNEAVTRQSIPNLQIARPNPGTMISNAGGGPGASGGTALGIKLALPDRCVVQIVGDGSFLL